MRSNLALSAPSQTPRGSLKHPKSETKRDCATSYRHSCRLTRSQEEAGHRFRSRKRQGQFGTLPPFERGRKQRQSRQGMQERRRPSWFRTNCCALCLHRLSLTSVVSFDTRGDVQDMASTSESPKFPAVLWTGISKTVENG